jgi:hypothetical protein
LGKEAVAVRTVTDSFARATIILQNKIYISTESRQNDYYNEYHYIFTHLFTLKIQIYKLETAIIESIFHS